MCFIKHQEEKKNPKELNCMFLCTPEMFLMSSEETLVSGYYLMLCNTSKLCPRALKARPHAHMLSDFIMLILLPLTGNKYQLTEYKQIQKDDDYKVDDTPERTQRRSRTAAALPSHLFFL